MRRDHDPHEIITLRIVVDPVIRGKPALECDHVGIRIDTAAELFSRREDVYGVLCRS